jgi:hypothetical protein
MIERTEYLKALETIKDYKLQCENDAKSIELVLSRFDIDNISLDSINMSVRLLNCLGSYFHKKLGRWGFEDLKVVDLQYISLLEFRSQRKVGRLTFIEFKELCAQYNIKPLQ